MLEKSPCSFFKIDALSWILTTSNAFLHLLHSNYRENIATQNSYIKLITCILHIKTTLENRSKSGRT